MIYFTGWLMCLLLCGVNTLYFSSEQKSWIEQIVAANNFETILYFCFSVIFIIMGRFAVWKILLCITVLNIVLICFNFAKKKKKVSIQKPFGIEWMMLIMLIAIFPLVRTTVEDIGSVSDQGSYFLHTLNLMEEKDSRVYYIPEYGEISEDIDAGLVELQDELSIFYHEEGKQQYYIHALSTWCSLPALFGKMFGLWKCMKACNYLYFLSVVNMFYLCRKINKTVYGGILSLFLFSLSPLVLYIAKAGLTEVVLVYLFILGLKLIFEKKYYLAGISIGMIGFMHISMYVYMPIITTMAFLESLKKSHREFAIFNIIQMVMFYISIWYAHVISPIYTERELGRLTGGNISFELLLVIIAVVVIVCIVLQLYVYFYPKKKYKNLCLKIYENFRGICLFVLGICVSCNLYYAYGLCYTDKYYVQYDSSNTWSMRSEYINSGIGAISHLNIINIGRASGIIGIILILYFLVKREEKSDFLKGLYFLEMYGLFVYTVIRMDVPFNYYASRYFVPYVIPLITLILEALALNVNWMYLAIMISVLYNRYFWPTFIHGAPFIGQFQILKDTLENIPYEAVVMCSPESTYANTRLTNNLRLLNGNRVYNFENLDEITLSENEAYIISDVELEGYDLVFSQIYDVQWSFGHGENGRYSTEVGTHEVPIYIYQID